MANDKTLWELFTCKKDDSAPKCDDSNSELVHNCVTCEESLATGEIVCLGAVDNCKDDDKLFPYQDVCVHKEDNIRQCSDDKDENNLLVRDLNCDRACIYHEDL